jgi:hypothetical protein
LSAIADRRQVRSLSELASNDASLGDAYAPVGYYQNIAIRGFAWTPPPATASTACPSPANSAWRWRTCSRLKSSRAKPAWPQA